MANPEHLKILKQGVEAWNKWREENPEVRPDLSGAYMPELNLEKINFSDTNLQAAILTNCNLNDSNFNNSKLSATLLSESKLQRATFNSALIDDTDFSSSNLSGSDFQKVRINKSVFSNSNLSNSNFEEAQLLASKIDGASLIKTNFIKSTMYKVKIYGIGAWDISKHECTHDDLTITPDGESEITVDDLEVAQFIYLLLNNQKIRDVIETITKKAVLILGRFTEERKKVLDKIKDELRRQNYLPIVFDFEPSASRDLTETVSLLADMSRFVVADLTDAKSIPQELSQIVPGKPSLPVLPIILKEQSEYAMFEHFLRYPWVLPLYQYDSSEILLDDNNIIIPAIIAPAEQKVAELRGKENTA